MVHGQLYKPFDWSPSHRLCPLATHSPQYYQESLSKHIADCYFMLKTF